MEVNRRRSERSVSVHEIRDSAEAGGGVDREQRVDCRHDCGSRHSSVCGGKTRCDRIIQSGGT